LHGCPPGRGRPDACEPGLRTASLRLLKAGDTVAYLAWAGSTWRFLDDEIHWKLAVAAVGLSGAWLALTSVRMNHLLKTYFERPVPARESSWFRSASAPGLRALCCLRRRFLATTPVLAGNRDGSLRLLLAPAMPVHDGAWRISSAG